MWAIRYVQKKIDVCKWWWQRVVLTLQWRHNDHNGVSNHQRLDCLLSRLFRRKSKKIAKLRVTGLCEGNSPVTGECVTLYEWCGTYCFKYIYIVQIIEKHLPEARGYADDHQVYLSFRPIPSTNQTSSVTAIENCVAELRSWMISNMLMVNDSKTEFLIVGSKQQLERVNIPFIHMGEDQITPVTSVRNLGVIFDSNLKMDMQITKACQNAYYHLHNIRRIRKFLSQEATCTIIHAFITSQIDYCNSLMNGLPENLINKLQRVQNTAARLVFNLRKYDRITPALVTLHWLPVKYRIEFKTLLIVFKGLHGKAPTYIQEMITPSKSKRYSIRSNEERVLKVPKFKHDTFGKRVFAVYGPLAWNCLPKEIRLCDEIEAFKRNLKTHLFVKFVNESALAIWFWRIIVKRPRMLSAQFVALYKPCKPVNLNLSLHV